jgi:hypothetical protein
LAATSFAQISFQNPTALALQAQRPDGVAVGDFDGDGDQDFAITTGQLQTISGPDYVEIFLNNGSGNFTAGQVIFLGNNVGSSALVAADFDSDTDTDLAVSLKNANMVQVLTNTSGVFTLELAVPIGGGQPQFMAGGDVDADGDVDLVTANRNTNDLTVLHNNGLGVFTSGGLLAVGLDPRGITLNDLNGDCDLDIAVAAHDSRRVDVLMGNGIGGFGAVQSYLMPASEKPSGMFSADLDADGDIDLITTLTISNAGQVVVLKNGGGAFSSTAYASNGLNPSSILSADLDGDGDKDIAAVDEDSDVVSVLPNLGAATFGAAGTFAVGVNPTAIVGTDLDGNGSIDLVVSNRDSSNVSVLANTSNGGTQTYCVSHPNSVGAGARIDTFGSVSLAANSFNLYVRCAPPTQNGLFFYGALSNNIPFHAGRLCVKQPVTRLGPIVSTDAAGLVVRQVDFNAAPANSGPAQIQAGSTWHFQFWYRDPTAGITNTTDALSATFRP